MRGKRWECMVVFFAALMVMTFTVGHRMAQGAQYSIAGGPAGGSYYPLSVGMSEIIQKNVPGARVDVVNTAGAIENATMVGTGESDFAFTNGDIAYEAYAGTGRYAGKKLADMRVLFGGVAGGPLHTVVAKNGGIKSYGQLKGKKAAIGPQGGTSAFVSLALLKYYGLQKEDLRISYLNYNDGIQALQDNQVDAAMAVGPLPVSAVKQLATFGQFAFDLLSIEDDKGQAFLKDYPFFSIIPIPADMYGLGRVVKTITSTNIMVVNAKVSNDEAYRITKAVFENMNVMYNAHPSARTIKLETAPVDYVPMHPGAEKYFREKGVMK
jgi:uncharacterized protein